AVLLPEPAVGNLEHAPVAAAVGVGQDPQRVEEGRAPRDRDGGLGSSVKTSRILCSTSGGDQVAMVAFCSYKAVFVGVSTTPRGVTPASTWKAVTRRRVSGPKSPSTLSLPCARVSRFCTSVTHSSCWPMLTGAA